MSLADKIKQDADAHTEVVQRRLGDAGEKLVAAIQAAAPKRSGRLAASIQSDVGADGLVVYSDAPYASVIDKRKPYFWKTIKENRAVVDAILSTGD